VSGCCDRTRVPYARPESRRRRKKTHYKVISLSRRRSMDVAVLVVLVALAAAVTAVVVVVVLVRRMPPARERFQPRPARERFQPRPARERFQGGDTAVGDTVVDNRCVVTAADGSREYVTAFDGLRAVNNVGSNEQCYVLDGAGDGLMDMGRAACTPEGAFGSPNAVRNVAMGSANAESHCVVAFNDGLSPDVYRKYGARLRDAAVERSSVFAGRVAELDAIRASMGTCGVELRDAMADTAALKQARTDADLLAAVSKGEKEAAAAMAEQCGADLVAWRAEIVSTSAAKTRACAASVAAKGADMSADCDARKAARAAECSGSTMAQRADYETRLLAMRRNCEVGPWSECDKACGPGLQRRKITTTPTEGGGACPPLNQQCQRRPCPVDCVLSAWGSCSATCGPGQQARKITTAAAYGGKPCEATSRACENRPCPTDCVMTPWSGYGGCSASCGYGSKTRYRTVVAQPTNGGAACGSNSDTIQCHAGECPDPIGGVWGDLTMVKTGAGRWEGRWTGGFRPTMTVTAVGGDSFSFYFPDEGRTYQITASGGGRYNVFHFRFNGGYVGAWSR
jgi:hypothetical protein